MSQTSITITDGVTTHSDVLNIINSNSSDAESRIAGLELVSGQGGGGDANSGDNISIFVNDSGYVNSLELDSIADENTALYDPLGVSGDAFDFDNFHNVPDYTTSTQQNISSVSSNLTLDADLGSNAKTILTEDVTGLDINNTSTGENGLIIVEQDGLGPWTFTCQHPVYAGDLADIATSATGEATIGWYNDGSELKLYVSNFVE